MKNCLGHACKVRNSELLYGHGVKGNILEGDEEQRYEEEDCNNDLKILRSEKGADEKGDAGHDLAEDDPSFPLSIFHICEFLDEGS